MNAKLEDQDRTIRTNDMGMAAFFGMNGHASQSVEWTGETCYWTFFQLPSLVELAELWASGKAHVEPREYNKFYAEVRRSFYESKDRANAKAKVRG